MKIPKNEKDRTLTRRTVKGAAGGLKGVHYEDDRRADPNTKLSPEAKRVQATKQELIRSTRNEAAAAARAEAGTAPSEEAKKGAPKEEQEMILDDEDAMTRDTKARQKRRAVVARDRFTVDKDAPDHRRKVRWDLLSDEEAQAQAEEEEVDFDADAVVASVFNPPRAHLFEPRARVPPGAPGLWLPKDIRAAFSSPLDYAKHCMLLAETFAQSTGAHREETIRYLAALFLGLPDARFGRRALLAWGPDTGIIDIYPLEVIEHVLVTRPSFLPRVRFGRWVAPELGERPEAELTVAPELPLNLTVPEDFLVRGFALKGGWRPGYCFEPGPERSTYALIMGTPGMFELLMAARSPDGEMLVDRLRIRVLGPVPEPPPAPPRDAERVAAWPIPDIPEHHDPEAPEVGPDEPESPGDVGEGIDRHELARLKRLDALGGPKGEEADPIFDGRNSARAPLRTGAEPAPSPLIPLEAPEDVTISAAEAAVLRLALAAGATMADVQMAGADPATADDVTDLLPIWPDTAVEEAYKAPAAAAAIAELAQSALADAAPSRLGTAPTEEFADAEPFEAGHAEDPTPASDASPPPSASPPAPSGPPPPAVPQKPSPAPAKPRSARPEIAAVIPAPFALTGEEIAAGPPTLPDVPSMPQPITEVAVEVGAQTIPDAPAVVGRPTVVVSGTAKLPGDGGPTARIDLVSDLASPSTTDQEPPPDVSEDPEAPAADPPSTS